MYFDESDVNRQNFYNQDKKNWFEPLQIVFESECANSMAPTVCTVKKSSPYTFSVQDWSSIGH